MDSDTDTMGKDDEFLRNQIKLLALEDSNEVTANIAGSGGNGKKNAK